MDESEQQVEEEHQESEHLQVPYVPQKYSKTFPAACRIFSLILGFIALFIYMTSSTWHREPNPFVVPPYFLLMSREAFLFLCIFMAFVGNLHVVCAALFSPTTWKGFMSSVYLLIFDSNCCFLLFIGGAACLHLYDNMKVAEPDAISIGAKKFACVLAILMALLHLMSAVMDAVFYARRRRAQRNQA